MSNVSVIDKAFKKFEKDILETTRMELNKWCWKILEAAVAARERNPRAHDFTGNLINSIVVCLYEKGKPYAPYFASDIGVSPAIRPKMRPLRNKSEKRYGFYPDYSGVYGSTYKPTVETNGGWGRADAEAFFASYRPKGNHMFDIVVAYPVEYANWIENQRQTTGILLTERYARITGLTFLQLGKAS